MNKKSLIFGILVTAIWFIGIYGFTKSNGYSLPIELNALGDFLAGIFAPVAFFWLILGYVQQGKQLDQNTKALEQQEKVLQLQIEEMKESVQQQTELVNIQKKQYEEQQNLLEPRFIISDAEVFNVLGREVEKNFGNNHLLNFNENIFVKVILNLINFGEEVFDLKIKENGKKYIILKVEHVAIGKKQSLEFDLTDLQIDVLNREQELFVEFDITFTCKNGKVLCKELKLLIYKRNELQFGAEFFLEK